MMPSGVISPCGLIDHHGIAHRRADGLGQIAAQNDRRQLAPVALAGLRPAVRAPATAPGVAVESRSLTVRSSSGRMPSISAPPSRAPRATSTCSYKPGRSGDDVRHLCAGAPAAAASRECRRPSTCISCTCALESEQPVLQVAPHAVGDGQRDDERRHARGHAGNGDGRDHADHGLPPLGLQVPRRHIELESHCAYLCLRAESPSWPRPRCRTGRRRAR